MWIGSEAVELPLGPNGLVELLAGCFVLPWFVEKMEVLLFSELFSSFGVNCAVRTIS